MCKVIAVSNQKGGTAKTTTAVNIGIGLAREGEKVMLIDADPQGNLTASLGIQWPDELDVSLADIFMRQINREDIPEEFAVHHHDEGVDFIPGNIDLFRVEIPLLHSVSKEIHLKKYIDRIKERYDYIIIDCMPSLGTITLNALTAATSVLIPVEAAYLPLKGLQQLIMTINNVREAVNPGLAIEGILLTKVDRRTNFSKDIVDLVRSHYGNDIPIFENVIPTSVKAAEAPAEGRSVFLHAPKGQVAQAYAGLVKEVIVNGQQCK